ncbi:MAG: NADH-quinone oxidoreductase subunit NuoE [Thermodesulfobacteriota bacterium]
MWKKEKKIQKTTDPIDIDRIDQTIDRVHAEPSALIQILLDIQTQYHWLPESALRRIAERLGVAFSEVYRTASFYKAFSLTPRGRHLIRLCLGTACHVRGAPRILNKIEQVLNLKGGGTTRDMKFTLERVNCLGCCALGPVMVVNDETHGNLRPAELENILSRYE